MRSRILGCAAMVSMMLVGCTGATTDHSTMPFLSRRIFAPDPNDTIIDLMPLRTQMRAYAKTIPEPIGIYFEYLPSGSSIGIGEQLSFVEASLLKVPVVIKAYQMKNEGLFSFEEVLRMEEEDIDRNFGSLWERGVGTEFPIRELVQLTLQESDNTALKMLGRKLGSVQPGFVNEVFDNLDIPKEMGEEGVMVSAKNYTSILRSLYLAASLPKIDAQEILLMLTKTVFSDQIPAGVPRHVPVAHKVGIYNKEGAVTYADCGIIYVPKRPYSLCIFVHGSEEHATRYMTDLSRMVYEFIAAADAVTYNER